MNTRLGAKYAQVFDEMSFRLGNLDPETVVLP